MILPSLHTPWIIILHNNNENEQPCPCCCGNLVGKSFQPRYYYPYIAYDGVFAFSWLAGHCQYEVQSHKEGCDPSLI